MTGSVIRRAPTFVALQLPSAGWCHPQMSTDSTFNIQEFNIQHSILKNSTAVNSPQLTYSPGKAYGVGAVPSVAARSARMRRIECDRAEYILSPRPPLVPAAGILSPRQRSARTRRIERTPS
eukprot:7406999-Pyramimonas_sp.AAC.1